MQTKKQKKIIRFRKYKKSRLSNFSQITKSLMLTTKFTTNFRDRLQISLLILSEFERITSYFPETIRKPEVSWLFQGE